MNEQIGLIARQIIDHEGYFVVVVKMITPNKIQVLVDGESGVSLKLCSEWNHKIRTAIETTLAAYQEGNFELEVSSFGIGEPLVDNRQYSVNKGRKIKVNYINAEEQFDQLEGKLIEINEEMIYIEQVVGKGKKQTKNIKNIYIKNIKKAIIEIDF